MATKWRWQTLAAERAILIFIGHDVNGNGTGDKMPLLFNLVYTLLVTPKESWWYRLCEPRSAIEPHIWADDNSASKVHKST
jgi:hypothetical protein